MKTRLIFLAIVFSFLATRGAYIENAQKTLTQPDGSVIHCFVSGDEFYNWVHDANNYTIVRNEKTLYWVYAVKENDQLKASDYIVGQANPSKLGIPRGLTLSAKEIEKRRSEYVNEMQMQAKKNNVKSLKQTGTINNIVVFIRFSDETEFPDQTHVYDSMFNSTNVAANSLYNYFKEVSYNNIFINSTLYPTSGDNFVLSYQDIYPRDYYQPYNDTFNTNGYIDDRTEREQGLLRRAIESIDGQVPTGLNLDFNSDGYVDNVCFIVRGGVGEWAELLWPHRWALFNNYAEINGLQVYDYNFQIEEFFFQPTRGVAVLCHEMFHTFGAPDLYHYDMEYRYFRSIGYWDLMDRSRNPSESMSAYMKCIYGGWIAELPEITTPGTYTLSPISSPTNNCYMIASPNSVNEYFVLEYRKKEGVFENSLPGEGLLIYRVNSDSWGTGNRDYPITPDELYVYRPDGIDTVTGQIDNAAFSLNAGRTEFYTSSNPQCLLADGSAGGITISEVTAIGNTISFCYNCPVSATETRTDDLKVYPNPAQNSIHISSPLPVSGVRIIGLEGKEYPCVTTDNSDIDISALPSGIYFVEIISAEKTQRTKLVKI